MNDRSQRAASFSSRGSVQAKACGSGWFGGRMLVHAAMLMMPAATFLLAGCHPWSHPGVRVPMGVQTTTRSWESVFAEEREPRVRQRDFEAMVLTTRQGSVTHGPIYFEDAPLKMRTDFDDYGWSGDDFLYMYYGPFRFLANMVLFPVSIIDTPPWAVMVSDGRPSRQVLGMWHDPAKADRKARSTCGCGASDAG